MANNTIKIPFYISRDGTPLTGAASQMEFESLTLLDGTDKSASAPAIYETGAGWYFFEVAYGVEPFDSGDLVGVIDADKNGSSNLANTERYIPCEVRLDYYGLMRLVNKMSQDKITGGMRIKDNLGQVILTLGISDNESLLERNPES